MHMQAWPGLASNQKAADIERYHMRYISLQGFVFEIVYH